MPCHCLPWTAAASLECLPLLHRIAPPAMQSDLEGLPNPASLDDLQVGCTGLAGLSAVNA